MDATSARFRRSFDRAFGRRERHLLSRAPRLLPTRSRPAVQEDKALYRCVCGSAFTAAVTTGVTCPACGEEQAW
jgi:hypothetical protein